MASSCPCRKSLAAGPSAHHSGAQLWPSPGSPPTATGRVNVFRHTDGVERWDTLLRGKHPNYTGLYRCQNGSEARVGVKFPVIYDSDNQQRLEEGEEELVTERSPALRHRQGNVHHGSGTTWVRNPKICLPPPRESQAQQMPRVRNKFRSAGHIRQGQAASAREEQA